MKTIRRMMTGLLAFSAMCQMALATVAVENVRGAQRAGTKLVDIYYDVTGINSHVSVTLEISSDGGSTWTVPASSLIGKVGKGVKSGKNLRITWNAASDWANRYSKQVRFRVTATESIESECIHNIWTAQQAMRSYVATYGKSVGDAFSSIWIYGSLSAEPTCPLDGGHYAFSAHIPSIGNALLSCQNGHAPSDTAGW